MTERAANWTLIYKGVDLTNEVAPEVTSVTYTDALHGKADEIQVDVIDDTGKWRGPWCPEPGDRMELAYGWRGEARIPAGTFELDAPQCSVSRGGDTMSIRGVAAPVTRALRTEKSKQWEDQTLSTVINEAASEAGLSVNGSFNETSYRSKRQRRETVLAFAVRMAEDTDHYASIRGDVLNFHRVDDIDGSGPIRTFEVSDPLVQSFEGSMDWADTKSKATVTHLHEDRKEKIEEEETDTEVTTGDVLRVVQRVDDEAQARLLAKSRLHRTNRNKRSGRLVLWGWPQGVAGSVVALGGSFGRWAGRYVIDQSVHELTRDLYITELELTAARS